MKRLLEFILVERQRYTGDGNNRFAFSLGQAARYETFLGIVADRHRQASDEYKRLNAVFGEELRTGASGS